MGSAVGVAISTRMLPVIVKLNLVVYTPLGQENKGPAALGLLC